MPGSPLVAVGASAICPHAGQVSIVSANTRVVLGGQPAATASDQFPIAGCPFTPGSAPPHPCVSVRWIVPSTRVRINGQPAVLQTSTGLCHAADQLPQGPPTVIATQVRVSGT
jgi:uncharacterized Zn-binding protein involved in type VI secretion